MGWRQKIERQINTIADKIKDKEQAKKFRTSAIYRVEAIVPLIISPLHIFIQNARSIFSGKTPLEALDSIRKTREIVSYLSKEREINDLLDFLELEFYLKVIEPKTIQTLLDRYFEWKDGHLISKEPEKNFYEVLLKHLRDAFKEADPETLKRPFGSWAKREKRGKVKSWPIVGDAVWKLYLLLLPIYLHSARREGLYPTNLLKIIAEILSTEIEELKKESFTTRDVKTRIQHRLQGFSRDELLDKAASVFKELSPWLFDEDETVAIIGEWRDEAILYPYKESKPESKVSEIPYPSKFYKPDLSRLEEYLKRYGKP